VNLVAQPTVNPAAKTSERIPSSVDGPSTLVDMFERLARVHKKPNSLNYKRDGRWIAISSDELLVRARRIAAGLYSLGVRHGDQVAILYESRPE